MSKKVDFRIFQAKQEAARQASMMMSGDDRVRSLITAIRQGRVFSPDDLVPTLQRAGLSYPEARKAAEQLIRMA